MYLTKKKKLYFRNKNCFYVKKNVFYNKTQIVFKKKLLFKIKTKKHILQ